MMRLEDVLAVLRRLAPEHLAEGWDHVGLQVGDPRRRVRTALLCIDLTQAVLDEALGRKADLVVAYHPPVFKPLPALTTLDPQQRIILEAASRRVAIYSPHTALDAAEGGVNDWLADGVGEGERRAIRPSSPQGGRSFKVVVFIPHEHADRLRVAMAQAGAGRIGEYDMCSFNLAGEGTFRGSEATNPTVGRPGRFERVQELRIEMVCPGPRLGAVVEAIRRTHPYEEPAFDICPLELAPGAAGIGQGRVVELRRPVRLSGLVSRLKKHLGMPRLEVAQAGAGLVRRVGLCAGAGGSLLAEAGGIDAFITGEMRHHDVLAALAAGTSVLLAGHTQTERPYLPVYRRRIVEGGASEVAWHLSRADTPPGTWR
jgi:dinuclear metal center YbgI/SA1388 family protein